MPPLLKLRIDALDELARQLRFAPKETLRRQMERAEALAVEIDPAINYPEDWLVFKITGYRPELDSPATFVGGALLADLSALVERLSAGAGLTWGDLRAGEFLDAGELARRWGVSRRTIDRWRRLGLLARRVMGQNGKPRQAFPLASVEHFERAHPAELAEARGYSRIEPALRERMIRRAGAYRRRLGCTLNQAAERLARRFGRGHETVRQLLRRHDEDAGEPVFAERGLLSAHDRRLIERASRRAIEPGEIGERLGRSRTAVRRVQADQRAERLRSLTFPALSHPAGVNVAILHADRLGASGPTDLLSLVQFARGEPALDARTERAWGVGYRDRLARCALGIAGLPTHAPPATVLDRIETDLRTAARLKAELVRSQLPLLLRTLDGAAGRSGEQLRSDLLADAIHVGVAAIAEAVDHFDPAGARSGRLAAPSGLAITRVLSRWVREHGSALAPAAGRATPRLAAGIAIPDFTSAVAPWQAFLDPPSRVRAVLDGLGERERDLLRRRFGWGGPAHTLAELAGKLKTTVIKTALLERKALRAALRAPLMP